MKTRYLLLVPALLALTGCVIDGDRTGSVQYSSESVELDDSEVVRVVLKMGAGDLHITDGGAKLMRGDFAYSVPSWKPQVRYNRSGKHASLTIEQPDTHHTRLGNTKYSWDLQLNKKAPVELALHFGAGQARLDLGSLDLRGVELDMGVGQLDMDLRGAPKHSYNVAIHGGHRRSHGSPFGGCRGLCRGPRRHRQHQRPRAPAGGRTLGQPDLRKRRE
jgi:hypothetical protein